MRNENKQHSSNMCLCVSVTVFPTLLLKQTINKSIHKCENNRKLWYNNFYQILYWLPSKHPVHSHRARIYRVFAPAVSPIGIIQYIWSSCFASLCLAFYLSAARGWDAKHLLSIFLSRQLYTAAGEVQAVVPAVTMLMLKVCLKPGALWLKLKYLYLSVSAALSTWNMLMVMWTECPFCCKQQWKKSAWRISAAWE